DYVDFCSILHGLQIAEYSFKDCTYADACLDRVLCKAYRLEFKGESLRNQKILTHRLTATDTPMVC
ncbi:ATP-binding protein, partial [Holdemanella porci]|nr:ATP-binding protein [Holdemanella porci]MBU9873030.1 ATP-binding protein [Holdemanella porci]MBU9888158.1 ATP-binding protein [Holdemanella porci]